ncbi:hypothetical protein F0562_024114 [Nyssa sinensis]|uniref:AT3G52170-like helix-turn-helix domain-containing protein n=1 Tax=Nyssa sinensis TaxID=561372 RepID=A0A5J5BMK7_9ASTE|nr:hypothetical protein F0562_024114 [Nyssa sinensis]
MQIARRFHFPSENSATSFSLSRRVFIEIANPVHGSNIRGRLFCASVPHDETKVQRGRKRVSKDERKAMVESFVTEYKAMNAGKFPTASHATKQVGGSYYVIRKILQELEYKSKISSIKRRDEHILWKEVAKENGSSNEVQEASSSQMTVDAGMCKDAGSVTVTDVNNVDICDSSFKYLEPKEGPQTSIVVKKTLPEEVLKPITGEYFNYVATQSHLLKEEVKEEFHPCCEKPEDNPREKVPEDLLDFDGPKPTKEPQQSPKFDKFERKRQSGDEEVPKKSSMWGNLKSLADGIMRMWRKL